MDFIVPTRRAAYVFRVSGTDLALYRQARATPGAADLAVRLERRMLDLLDDQLVEFANEYARRYRGADAIELIGDVRQDITDTDNGAGPKWDRTRQPGESILDATALVALMEKGPESTLAIAYLRAKFERAVRQRELRERWGSRLLRAIASLTTTGSSNKEGQS